MPALAEGEIRVCFHSYMTGLKTSQFSSVSLNIHTHTSEVILPLSAFSEQGILKFSALFYPFSGKIFVFLSFFFNTPR